MNKLEPDQVVTLDASVAAQAQRRARLAELVYPEIAPRIKRQEDGATLDLGEHDGDTRVVLWIARALLISSPERRPLANQLIVSAPYHHACHFTGVAAMGILTQQREWLTPAARQALERFVLRHLSDWMTEDYRFHGANDNAPFGCNAILSLAGQYFDRPALAEFARERFQRLRRLLDLRGYIHEANSPTYSAISLLTLADLVELTRDETIRAFALRAEQRIWQEVLLHLHPVIRHQVGPFSRGYPDDNASQCTNVMIALYCALGEISPFNPVRMLFPPPPGTFAHNSWLFQWACCAGASAVTYHPPVELAERCLQRPAPFFSLGSNEFMPIGGAPCGQSTVQVYGEQDWALSSFGSRLWAGQTVPLHALYRRQAVRPAAAITEQLAALRSVYTRYHVSERFAILSERDGPQALQEVASDHAAAFVVQHQGAALLGYVPIGGPEKVRTMKASVVFPLHHSRPDEIWHGDRQVAGFSGSFPETAWAFVRDGDIYLGFHPLIAKQEEVMLCTQQYADYGEHGMISFFNRCGFAERALDGKERRAYGSGLVMEISCQRLEGTFARFRQKLAAATMTQRQYGSQRDLSYARDGVTLELIYDFEQLNLRRAAVNDQIVSPATKLVTGPALPLLA